MQTTTQTNNVFFNADNARIQVYINSVFVAVASNSYRLAKALRKHNVNVHTDTLVCSSSIDFASEEGFATDACAHTLINNALQIVQKYN
tara:strand:+ start:196 stop:462 length:267 start_codon:yes stop_codon:yes gene_type:complete